MSGSSLAQPLACTPSGLTALQQGASDAVNSRGSYAWPALEVSDSNPRTRLQRRTRTPVDYVMGVPGFACVENRTEPEISESLEDAHARRALVLAEWLLDGRSEA